MLDGWGKGEIRSFSKDIFNFKILWVYIFSLFLKCFSSISGSYYLSSFLCKFILFYFFIIQLFFRSVFYLLLCFPVSLFLYFYLCSFHFITLDLSWASLSITWPKQCNFCFRCVMVQLKSPHSQYVSILLVLQL